MTVQPSVIEPIYFFPPKQMVIFCKSVNFFPKTNGLIINIVITLGQATLSVENDGNSSSLLMFDKLSFRGNQSHER